MRNRTILLLLWAFLVLNNKATANLDHLDVEVEHQCIQHCPLQNRTDVANYDYACNYGCNIEQCTKGCKLWKKALNSSCKIACDGISEHLSSKILYCVIGCNDAMTKYFSQLKARLQILPPPALVADSLNATSLKLEWNYPESKKSGLNPLIQWRYEELAAGWQFCQNVTWENDETVAFINNLQPYTKYRFRVAIILGHPGDLIVSPPSVVISTLPYGLPASQPIIVRAAPIDCTRISVSWEPGPFPHGPLLSYVLQISDYENRQNSEVKEIPPRSNFYMFRNLRPKRTYNISIIMRNGFGSGPPASVSLSTPAEPLVKDNQEPVLILGTDHGVTEQGTNVSDEPVLLYSTLKILNGIAIHIRKKLLFVSESDRYIIRMPLTKGKHNYTVILEPSQINFLPLDLSMDWLNDQLYILGEVNVQDQKMWQIVRCDLDGKGLTIAIAGLRFKPINVEVDPFNGYLFWVVQGHSKGGLYRLDISDISNGIKHEIQPELILNEPNLGGFVVDHTNFCLLVSNQKQNTINSVLLDGSELYNTRPNVIKSKLQKVISLAKANEIYYWTNGDVVFYEEYHSSDNTYFHNSFPDLTSRIYKKVFVNLESSQPIPRPVNPPTNLQAIFGSNTAKLNWRPPYLVGIQGKGAWQNWSYEVFFKDLTTNKTFTHKNINTTRCTIRNLTENTEYLIKVLAYTSFAKGPPSTEFKGSTLMSKSPLILWSGNNGLLKSDSTGDNVETLIHQSQMKDYYFTDITWYKNQLYLVTNNSQIHWYDLESHKQNGLNDIDSVGSIAVDWIGQKLYWSNTKQQLIIRGNLNGTQQEPLPILTLAKELNIDSIKAFLYWSTGYVVTCAHLNGADKMEYYEVQVFSGKKIMGLTLDMDIKYLYWIVRESESSDLFRAPMAGYSNEPIMAKKISSLQKPDMQGPLCYFHKRLLWLQDDRNAAISDLEGKNIATISGKSMSGLTMVYVMYASQHSIPNITNINVIPEAVNKTSLKVIGSSSSFNITWDCVKNINYGTVFYEVKVDNSTKITKNCLFKYWKNVAPYTELHIAIRAYTYWGSSLQITTKLYSPPSTPSTPKNLRSYITYEHGKEHPISISFRWDPPLTPNGILQGYKVHCWGQEKICDNVIKGPDELEFQLENLGENEIYNFQVQAFTQIGDGDLSDILNINSSEESPLPTLLMSSLDDIFIQDIDNGQILTILKGLTPISVGYSIKEHKIFWTNEIGELWMYNMMNLNKSKILDVGYVKYLSVNWLERTLYYVELIDSYSIVNKIDLNLFDRGIIKKIEIFSTTNPINVLEVSPITKKLYWIEDFNLLTCNLEGNEKTTFFNERVHNSKANLEKTACNCPFKVNIDSFSIDHSNPKMEPSLVFYEARTNNIIESDVDGCLCNVITTPITNASTINNLQSDFGSLYWLNKDDNYLLYTFVKRDETLKKKEVKANNYLIFGPHMQPYPRKECLIPLQDNLTASLIDKESNSLTISMPDYNIDPECPNKVSIATIEYKIEYGELNTNLTDFLISFDKKVTIKNLKPFTNYSVTVSLSNYYTEIEDVVIGPSIIFKTAPGPPSVPRNLTAKVLNPNLVKVFWLPPEKLNGANVYYEIYWKTEGGPLSGIRQKPIIEYYNSIIYLTTILNKLSPNETYTIWLKAYSENNQSSAESEKIQIITYPEPNDIILINKTAYNLTLEWRLCCNIINYNVEFSPLTSNNWENVEIFNDTNFPIIFVNNLIPKTQYKFRLILKYKNYPLEEFIWPPDTRIIFETLGDRPTRPGIPIIQYIKPKIYKIWWEASKDNGSPIVMYMLEASKSHNYRNKRSTNRTAFFYTAPSIEETDIEWESVYNGTDTSWIIDGLTEKYKYSFRVSSLNSYGWSDPSEESMQFDLAEAESKAATQSPMNSIIIAVFTPFTIFVLVILILFCRKLTKPKKVPLISISRGPDVELATLRELPRRGIHNTNILYVATQSATEETLLPHIRRDQITLVKRLGSGAFGEVFEGKAKFANKEMKVAVKTLKKRASDEQKNNFLQEAQLMSNFKHEHILQLLGVCLDNDPHFIIMELMQGGDLQTYLRSSRNPSSDIPTLTLIELLKMCVDVSKGCKYLEEMHFVHRDLACRNCLVSCTKSENRIIKIGDFGLTRDIYKNDYYRKEGDGLLPVRWMAPESLVDGVFTSQSDVWAFGVLLWEIMTLGQQPYPARSNMEVLDYVRKGGRLGKPVDCPEALHDLMLKCWEFNAEKRPTFKYCLDVLTNLHLENLRNPTSGTEEPGQYINTVQENFYGFSNAAYFRNDSGMSWPPDDELKEKTPFLCNKDNPSQTEEIPKYLELLYVPPNETNDGYEIPKQIIQESTRKSSSDKNCVNKVKDLENLLKNDEILKV